MLKKNKGLIVLTSAVCLLPVLAGLMLWSSLPERIPTHWNFHGQIDGWNSKSFAVVFLPVMILAIHWLCIGATALDPKSSNIPQKLMTLTLWICPCVSVGVCALMYGTAMGMEVAVNRMVPALVGVVMVVTGNYLPKCRQNYTMGIKLPWTLRDEGNWNATHRFGGWVSVAAGIVIILGSLLGQVWLVLAVPPLVLLATLVYSYRYYRKHR